MAVQLLTPEEKACNSWEWPHVHNRDASRLDLTTVRAVCLHVWSLAQMPGRPPLAVQVGPDDQEYIPGAFAYVEDSRLCVQRTLSTTMVLHELSHVLTDDPLDALEMRAPVESEMHGPVFLQNYLWLLGRLMGPLFNPFRMRATMPAILKPAALPLHPVIRGVPRSDLA